MSEKDSNNKGQRKVVALFDNEIDKFKKEKGFDPLEGLEFIYNEAKGLDLDNYVLIGFNDKDMWVNVNTTMKRSELVEVLIEALYFFHSGADEEL